jgi:hypothetical protein
LRGWAVTALAKWKQLVGEQYHWITRFKHVHGAGSRKITKFVRSQVLMVVSMKRTASWDAAPCRVVMMGWDWCLRTAVSTGLLFILGWLWCGPWYGGIDGG